MSHTGSSAVDRMDSRKPLQAKRGGFLFLPEWPFKKPTRDDLRGSAFLSQRPAKRPTKAAGSGALRNGRFAPRYSLEKSSADAPASRGIRTMAAGTAWGLDALRASNSASQRPASRGSPACYVYSSASASAEAASSSSSSSSSRPILPRLRRYSFSLYSSMVFKETKIIYLNTSISSRLSR